MATFTDPLKLAAAQKTRAGVVVRSVRALHRKLVYEMADEMIALASGTISSRELARRGHPFGRRRGRISLTLNTSGRSAKYRGRAGVVPTPLLPINRQTGALVKSLRVIPESGIGLQSYRAQFTAPHAKFVLAKGGTRRMVARGYWPELRKRFQPKNRQMIYEARLAILRASYRK